MSITALALSVALGLAPLVAVNSAAAGPKTIVPGTLDCTGVKGTILFNPPLNAAGGSTEHATMTVALSSCTASAGTSATPTKGVVTGQLSTASNSCASLLTNTAVANLHAVWTPKKDGQSFADFSGFSVVLTPTLGFSLPNGGGTVTGSGSYSGSDAGHSTKASAFTSMTQSQALKTCVSTGLKKLKLTSGTIHVG